MWQRSFACNSVDFWRPQNARHSAIAKGVPFESHNMGLCSAWRFDLSLRVVVLLRSSKLNQLGKVPKGTTEVSVVQKAYRALMRLRSFVVSEESDQWSAVLDVFRSLEPEAGSRILHPDRAGQSEDVVKAVEKVREARGCLYFVLCVKRIHFTWMLLYMIFASCQCQAKEACERGLSRQEPCAAQATSVLSLWSLELAGKKKHVRTLAPIENGFHMSSNPS